MRGEKPFLTFAASVTESMKRRYESDINRIFSLIYEDEPVPARVNDSRPEIPAPRYTPPEPFIKKERRNAFGPDKRSREKERRKTVTPDMLSLPKKRRETFALDTGSLEGIRKAAGRTMEKLLTEEDLDFGREEPVQKEAAFRERIPEKAELPFGLTEQEDALLRALLKDGNSAGVLSADYLLSVTVDSINEKLFDEFGDTVIDNVSPPELIEDYREELKTLLSA